MAVKQCSTLIPLCHTIPIAGVDVFSNVCNDEVLVRVTVKSVAVTGVEMEVLMGASVALLIYIRYDNVCTQTCNQ